MSMEHNIVLPEARQGRVEVWSLKEEIQKQVEREDTIRWARTPTPPIPKLEYPNAAKMEGPSLYAFIKAIKGCMP